MLAGLKSDQELQQNVWSELNWDPRVNTTGVRLRVDRGIVLLTGTIGSYAEKLAAKNAAHRVAGVLDVVNDELDACVERMRAVVTAERARLRCMQGVSERIISTFRSADGEAAASGSIYERKESQ